MIRTGQGDVSAFEQLYAMTVDAVTTMARSVVINPEQADEVVQEVYLELWGCADRFDPTRGAALAWLLRIARCRSIDRVRHSEVTRVRDHAYFQESGRATPDDSVLEEVLRAETSQELRSAVNDLSARQRQTVWLTYFDHCTGPQISTLLGLPLGTVKSRLRDGVLNLRAALGPAD